MIQYTLTKGKLKDIIIHLRFLFSILLMPVFLLAFTQAENSNLTNAILIFLILHLLVYPSSNGYNSLMDNDTGSIGGIKHPPKVPKEMMYVSIFLDALSLILCIMYFDKMVGLLVLGYILASRAYSYRKIRLKKYAIIGYLTVTIFQGPIVYLITKFAIDAQAILTNVDYVLMVISFLIIGAGYPLSQIYQHKQDREDGVNTISMKCGIKGTFILSGLLFFIQASLMVYYFYFLKHDQFSLILYFSCLLPVFFIFNKWMVSTFKNIENANFENTMLMNKAGAIAINIFFILITIKHTLS